MTAIVHTVAGNQNSVAKTVAVHFGVWAIGTYSANSLILVAYLLVSNDILLLYCLILSAPSNPHRLVFVPLQNKHLHI